MNTALNLHCPACGAEIVPRLGCCAHCLTRAFQLQAARFGTELSCHECGRQHVVLQTDASRDGEGVVAAGGRSFSEADWQVEALSEPEAGTGGSD